MADTTKKALTTDWLDADHTWLSIGLKGVDLLLRRYQVQRLLFELALAEGPLPPPAPEDADRFDIVVRRSDFIPGSDDRGRHVLIGPLSFELTADELGEWLEELPRRLAEPAEPDADDEDDDDDDEYDEDYYDDDDDDDEDDTRLSLPLVTCDGCGVCCESQGSPPGYGVFFNDDPPEVRRQSGKAVTGFAWEEIPTHLRDELEAYHKAVDAGEIDSRYEEGLPCLWLDVETGRCRNYEWRPLACKHFPVGGKDCRGFHRDQGID
jgi:Fe-S-cluster containining protein